MKDENLRKAIQNYVQDRGITDEKELPILLDYFDKSIVGISSDGRIIYNYTSMICELIDDDHCSWDDAQEWIDYNTMRTLPYLGAMRPIVVDLDKRELLGIYGEEEDSLDE